MQEFLASKQREKSRRFGQVLNILYLCLISTWFILILCIARLTCLQCFLQGDMGLTGPPGIPGPPVSTIYCSLYLHRVICVLDQSSVLFKSAAGKRSMAFHSAYKVAAIKTSAPYRGTASIKRERRQGAVVYLADCLCSYNRLVGML